MSWRCLTINIIMVVTWFWELGIHKVFSNKDKRYIITLRFILLVCVQLMWGDVCYIFSGSFFYNHLILFAIQFCHTVYERLYICRSLVSSVWQGLLYLLPIISLFESNLEVSAEILDLLYSLIDRFVWDIYYSLLTI